MRQSLPAALRRLFHLDPGGGNEGAAPEAVYAWLNSSDRRDIICFLLLWCELYATKNTHKQETRKRKLFTPVRTHFT